MRGMTATATGEGLALSAGEPLPRGLSRLIEQELRHARAGLDADHPDPAVGIHETRKSIKRLRALLRLARPAVPEAEYDEPMTALRDAGRALGPSRDAAVVQETLVLVVRDEPDARVAAALTRAGEALADRTDTSRTGLAVARARTCLESAAALLSARDWAALGPDTALEALTLVYASGQERMRRALDVDPSRYETRVQGEGEAGERWHAWRRRAKDLWYLVQLFEAASPVWLGSLEVALDELTDTLGLDHDHVMTGAALAPHLRDGGMHGPVADRLAAASGLLRIRAERIGVKVYGEAPEAVARSIIDHWTGWLDPPAR